MSIRVIAETQQRGSMDPMIAVLTPIGELGPNVSASVYKLPASVLPASVKREEFIAKLVAKLAVQEPRLQSPPSGQAHFNCLMTAEGGGLLAIGGFMEPDVFEKVHGVLMSIDGVEFVVGLGPGSSTLPRTA